MSLRVDFIAQRRWPAAGIALATAALGLLAWQANAAFQDAQRLREQRAGLAALRQPPAPRPGRMSAADARRHAQIEAVARELATPWDGLLALFESHAQSRVALLQLEPDAATGRVLVVGRAPNSRAAADYLIALEHDPRLSEVLLSRHERLREEPGQPVEFRIVAGWNVAARGARPSPARAETSAAAAPEVLR